MSFRLGTPKPLTSTRRESRVPIEVGVQISGHHTIPGTETTFTENVSSHGARVLSTRRWKRNEQLIISTLTGSFRAIARIAYCQNVVDGGFAVGLEFVNPTGTWVLAPVPVTTPEIRAS